MNTWNGGRQRGVAILVGCRFWAMKVDGPNPYIFDRRSVCHDTSMRTWRRPWGVFDRSWAVLLASVSSLDMPFVHCQEKVSYCWKLLEVMGIFSVTEILTRRTQRCLILKNRTHEPYVSWGSVIESRSGVEVTAMHYCTKRIVDWLA